MKAGLLSDHDDSQFWFLRFVSFRSVRFGFVSPHAASALSDPFRLTVCSSFHMSTRRLDSTTHPPRGSPEVWSAHLLN